MMRRRSVARDKALENDLPDSSGHVGLRQATSTSGAGRVSDVSSYTSILYFKVGR